MKRVLSSGRQRWRTRATLRAHGSPQGQVTGLVLYAAAIVSPLSALYTRASSRQVVASALIALVAIATGTMKLFTVPPSWTAALNSLRNKFTAWIFIGGMLLLGLLVVLPGPDWPPVKTSMQIFCLALVARIAGSLTEPETTSIEERQLVWRIRRTALLHAGFMPVFALGITAAVVAIEHAGGQQVPFTWPAGVIVATAAFIFKVHQRIRKVCTQITGRITQVQIDLASLGAESSATTTRKAIKDLEAALRTPIQTGYHRWGTPIVSDPARAQLIDWLNKRVEEQRPVLDSIDAEYRGLIAIAEVCGRWTDVAA